MENPPTGSVIGRCIGLIDVGTQQHPGFQGGQPWASRDVKIVWELPMNFMEGIYRRELAGKPFKVQMTVKQSLHPSAKLRKFLTSWRGKDFTKDEIEKFNPRSIVGRACRLTLVEKNGFVNVDGIAPLGAGEKCPKQFYPSLVFSLEKDEFDQKVYSALPDNLKKKIAASPEFRALFGSDGDQGDAPEGYEEPPADDDNVPF